MFLLFICFSVLKNSYYSTTTTSIDPKKRVRHFTFSGSRSRSRRQRTDHDGQQIEQSTIVLHDVVVMITVVA
jgi:hypothetical protein